MNNFNPDQNPHILSSPETQEGGAGGINRQTNQAEQENAELSGNVLKGQEGLDIAEQLDVEDEDSLENALGGLVDDLGSAETNPEENGSELEGQLDSLIAEVVEASKPKFEVGADGLSLKGSEIQGIKSQIQQLESGEGDLVDSIKSQITESMQEKIISLEAEKFKLEGEKTKITNSILQAYNKVREKDSKTKTTLEDFTTLAMKNQTVSKAVETNNTAIKAKEDEIKAFDSETKTLIETAIQNKKIELHQQLTKVQVNYTETGAEAHDKKVLLERQLKEQLTDPDQLFSKNNITSIFAIYGIKEGLEKLEELKKESDQAREQAARDEFRKESFEYAKGYKSFPDLTQALIADIQPKLEALQVSNPESEDIKTALSKEGKSRLDYLVDSGDPQLEKLAFWFDRDANIDQVLADHPQFAQYVEKTTNQKYEQQQKEIQERGSRRDNARRVAIDGRIAEQLESSKSTKVEELQRELSGLQYDKIDSNWIEAYDKQDSAMLSEKEKLHTDDINQFQTELQQALESGQIKFEKGQFSALDNIPAKQQEINTKQENLLKTIKPLLDNAGYTLQSLESLPDIVSAIDQDKQKANSKWFGRGKKQAETLGNLATEVSQTIEQYNALKSERQQNSEQFRNNMESISKLKESYQNLPQSIQKSLTSLENPNFETITQTINIGVESIQNYQTPPEIAEKRSQIQALESKIAETRDITAPKASTQSRV